jgi:hypothetical protein
LAKGYPISPNPIKSKWAAPKSSDRDAANLGQFALLVAVNALAGGVVSQERTVIDGMQHGFPRRGREDR